MTAAITKMRWGAERRLEFIEFRVFWEGGVNRSDLTESFGISVPQASSDLSIYQKIVPGNLLYNASEKRYMATPEFQPRFITPSADKYLAQLRSVADGVIGLGDTWIQHAPTVDAMPIPTRSVKPTVLRKVLEALHARRSVEISYQSMNPKHPDRLWRWITPHAFGFDGVRWHVRALCHNDRRFKDFVLSRCEDTRNDGEPGANPENDIHWAEQFCVILEPNPQLSQGQREAIASDYSMTNARLCLSIRRALLFYFNKHLRLDMIKYDPDPAKNPIVVANRTEFDDALRSAGA